MIPGWSSLHPHYAPSTLNRTGRLGAKEMGAARGKVEPHHQLRTPHFIIVGMCRTPTHYYDCDVLCRAYQPDITPSLHLGYGACEMPLWPFHFRPTRSQRHQTVDLQP